MTWECNVHVVRHLCGQFMMRKRRDQADHASRDPKTDRDPIWIYEGRGRRQPIEPLPTGRISPVSRKAYSERG
jgi:hypothetical protein